jgi:hypothetical protein
VVAERAASPGRFDTAGSARRPDVLLLFATRTIRLFAYGALSVVLVLYLTEVGLSDPEIGLLLT